MLTPMKQIAYSKSVLKVLRKMPTNEAQWITSKVEQYATDPKSLGKNVIRLAGSPFLRLRVGDWRVVMDDLGQVLQVLKIGPRGSVYKD